VGVRFDTNAAIADLKRNLLAAMVQLQDELLRETQAGMRDREHADSWYEGDVTEVAGIIAAEVVGGAWAAMDEHGRGSLMDGPTDNPALDEYRASSLWNPLRTGNAIVGRPKGEYETIFGETRYSSGRNAGKNLEMVPSGKFRPKLPSHALQTAMRWMEQGRMQAVVQEAFNGVDWGRYLIVDGR
jgi:hypothetical protein